MTSGQTLTPRIRPPVVVNACDQIESVASSDVEASEYDLGVTSVRLIRVGNVVQIVFSKRQAAEYYYAGAAARFKKDEEEWRTE